VGADGTVACRFSYGLAVFPTDGRSLDALIRVADQRMYLMKELSHVSRGKVTRKSLLSS
jgi:GGDEF domain-containing protein